MTAQDYISCALNNPKKQQRPVIKSILRQIKQSALMGIIGNSSGVVNIDLCSYRLQKAINWQKKRHYYNYDHDYVVKYFKMLGFELYVSVEYDEDCEQKIRCSYISIPLNKKITDLKSTVNNRYYYRSNNDGMIGGAIAGGFMGGPAGALAGGFLGSLFD